MEGGQVTEEPRYPEAGDRYVIAWGEEETNRGVMAALELLVQDLSQRGQDLRTVQLSPVLVARDGRTRWEATVRTGAPWLAQAWLNGGALEARPAALVTLGSDAGPGYPDRGVRAALTWRRGASNHEARRIWLHVCRDLDRRGHDLRTLAISSEWLPAAGTWRSEWMTGCAAGERQWLRR